MVVWLLLLSLVFVLVLLLLLLVGDRCTGAPFVSAAFMGQMRFTD